MKTNTLPIRRLFATLLLISTSAHAGNFPWDQGHDTADMGSPDRSPEACDMGVNGGDDGFGGDEGEGCGKKNNHSNADNAKGSPVYLKSGNLVWVDRDIALAGKPYMGLDRTFNSKEHRNGMFGKGWISSFETSVIKTVAYRQENNTAAREITKWSIRLDDGRSYEFTREFPGSPITPQNGLLLELEELSNGQTKLSFRSGAFYLFGQDAKLIKKQDKNGNQVNFTYQDGQLTKVSDTNGRFMQINTNASGYISSITDHTGRTWAYAYNANGEMESMTNPAGEKRSFTYADYQPTEEGQVYTQLKTIIDATGVKQLDVTYLNGKVNTYTHGQNRYRYTYVNSGQVRKSDLLDRQWTYYLNADGMITRRILPSGAVYEKDFNIQQLPETVTNPNGHEVHFEYDNRYRLISRTEEGEVTSYEYGDDFWPTSVTSPLGLKTVMTYDEKGNVKQTESPASGATKFTWSNKGELLSIEDANASKWQSAFNQVGQVVTSMDPLGNTSLITYDAYGFPASITNAEGEVTTYQYDLMGRLLSETDATGATTQFTYDAAGRLLTITAANGETITYTYDVFGRLETDTHFDGTVTTYSYNVDNTVSEKQLSDGTVYQYTYDDLMQPIEQFVGTVDGESRNGITTTYTYNALGQMLSAEADGKTVELRYELRGRPFQETMNGVTFTRSYDADGRISTETSGHESISFAYSDRGLPEAINTPAGQFSYNYDPVGRMTARGNPNGTATNYAFDTAGRLASIQHGGLATYSYGYDGAGRITHWNGDNGNKAYEYDTAGRLTRVTGPTPESFSYDVMGNRTNDNARFDAANRLLEDDSFAYSYDARGNRISRLNKSNNQREEFDYNELNQLIAYRLYGFPLLPNNVTRSATYTYGPLGRRWSKDDSQTGLTEFIWSGSTLVSERRGNAIRTFRGSYSMDGSTPYIVHSDHLGTPQMLSNSSGGQAWSGNHYAFGELESEQGSTSYPIRFPGQYADAESGLHQNYFRDYDPGVGRYLQSDPIGLIAGYNTYTYVHQNPLVLIDPLGLVEWSGLLYGAADVAAGGAAVAGGVVIIANSYLAGPGAPAVSWKGVVLVLGGLKVTFNGAMQISNSWNETTGPGICEATGEIMAGTPGKMAGKILDIGSPSQLVKNAMNPSSASEVFEISKGLYGIANQ